MKRSNYWMALLTLALAACGPAATPPPPGWPVPTQAAEGVPAEPAGEAQPAQEADPTEAAAPVPVQCDGQPTPAQGEGPYYTPGSPERTSLVEEGTSGTPLVVTGAVMDTNCQPIAGARVDFWQTDGDGAYDNVGYGMRGHQFTADDGTYALTTVVPGVYPGRTPHIHVKVFGPDGGEWLTSQIYIPGLSEDIPDGIFDSALLAREVDPAPDGTRHLAFDFVVRQ